MEQHGIINVNGLLDIFENNGVKILDASWHMPDSGRNGRSEYEKAHIPGALFFDTDTIVAPDSPLPHTIPDQATFQRHMRQLGVNNSDQVIVYDNSPLKSAARAWWMLRAMGHKNVAVLDGGLQAWRAANGPVQSGNTQPTQGDFIASKEIMLLKLIEDMRDNINTQAWQVVDARAAPRFEGAMEEPRPGLASGHIPGALNVPFSTLYTPDGTLKTQSELTSIFKEAGVVITAPITTSCGSGVTACNLAHALYTLGNENVAVYDGSWSEWGTQKGSLIAKGQ